MKRFFLFCASALFVFSACGQSLQPAWATPRILKIPESVLYYPKTKTLYVSNINGKPAEKNGQGFIAHLDATGKILQLRWATGLNAPKGMAIKGKHLFVSDIDRLAEIDLRTGKIIRFFPAPDAKFLNDVTVGPDGKIYVTDTGLGAVFILQSDKLQVWKKDPLLKGANGLAVEGDKLLIGTNGHLVQADPKTGNLYVLVRVPHGIDGLVPVGNGKYVLSDWSGEIRWVTKQGAQVVLSNTTAEHINAADLGYIPSKKIILIPTFFDNRVVAKKLTGL